MRNRFMAESTSASKLSGASWLCLDVLTGCPERCVPRHVESTWGYVSINKQSSERKQLLHSATALHISFFCGEGEVVRKFDVRSVQARFVRVFTVV